jgi:dTDP-4-amino-4,6-dideoxygalactose transaminase
MFPITRVLDIVAPNKLEALTYEERRSYDPNQPIRRLSDIQGALGIMELSELDRRNSQRRSNALRLLDRITGTHGVTLPQFDATCENSFNAVAIRTAFPKELAHRLRRSGFDTRTDYMEWFGSQKDFEEGVLYLPNHPAMSSDDIDRLAQAVRTAMHPI